MHTYIHTYTHASLYIYIVQEDPPPPRLPRLTAPRRRSPRQIDAERMFVETIDDSSYTSSNTSSDTSSISSSLSSISSSICSPAALRTRSGLRSQGVSVKCGGGGTCTRRPAEARAAAAAGRKAAARVKQIRRPQAGRRPGGARGSAWHASLATK